MRSWLSDDYSAELASTVRDTLKKKSSGTYLWVGFAIEELRKTEISDVEACLNSLPAGLNAIYERMLQQVEPHKQETVRKILRWCTYAARPLTPDEMAVILDIKPDQPAILSGKLAYCGHLLSISETSISLVHQSVLDFLTHRPEPGKAVSWFSPFEVDHEQATLASACIDQL